MLAVATVPDCMRGVAERAAGRGTQAGPAGCVAGWRVLTLCVRPTGRRVAA